MIATNTSQWSVVPIRPVFGWRPISNRIERWLALSQSRLPIGGVLRGKLGKVDAERIAEEF